LPVWRCLIVPAAGFRVPADRRLEGA